MKNKKIENQKSKKGFSLVEVMVAIFVFSIIMVMVSGAFASFLKNYAQTKKNQRNVENAQYAMNIMAKTIRTSHIYSNFLISNLGSDPLKVFDYSRLDNACIEYKLEDKKIKTAAFDAADIDDCFNHSFDPNTYSDLTSDIIINTFFQASASNDSATPKKYGKVTISLEVEDPTQSSLNFPIQMTVSLRQ